MGRKPVIAFLIKVFPLFVLLLLAWHAAGLSRAYHTVLAGFLSHVCPGFDPTGTVHSVVFNDFQFKFRLIIDGSRVTLAVNAVDITSNTAVLAALYLASPIRGSVRQFVLFFVVSLAALFAVHAITAVSVSQEALMTHPGVMRTAPFSARQIRWIPRYNVFYEEMGMYLSVLLLWFPYITWRITRRADKKNRSAGDGPVSPRATAPDSSPGPL